MHAYQVSTPNGPFEKITLPTPTPAPNEVLVKIHASGISPLDLKIRAGQAAHARQPLPAILGLDMSGTVESIGENVTAFQPGDEVYGMVGGVGGHQGTLAEYIAADAALLAPKPAHLTHRQAAALPLVTITAWEGLVDRAKVHAGQTVLIHAGAGGVGYAAIQIALAHGARVYATVSPNKRHLVEALQALGAPGAPGATPIDRDTPVPDYLAAHTNGEGFDIVYDTLGGPVLDASFLAAKRYTGHVVSCLGWGTHALAPLSFRSATYSGVFTLYPLLSGNDRAHQGEILRQATYLTPLLTETRFTASQINEAYDHIAQNPTGKVVVEL